MFSDTATVVPQRVNPETDVTDVAYGRGGANKRMRAPVLRVITVTRIDS